MSNPTFMPLRLAGMIGNKQIIAVDRERDKTPIVCEVFQAKSHYAALFVAAPALYYMLDRIIQDIDSGWNASEADEHFPWLAEARRLANLESETS